MYIKEDYPPKVLQIRKSLQENLKREQENGKKAIIKYDKLVILTEKQNNRDSNPQSSYQPKRKLRDDSPIDLNKSGNSEASENRQTPQNKKSKTGKENKNITQYFKNHRNTRTSPKSNENERESQP